jgi:hypothetical protein
LSDVSAELVLACSADSSFVPSFAILLFSDVSLDAFVLVELEPLLEGQFVVTMPMIPHMSDGEYQIAPVVFVG